MKLPLPRVCLIVASAALVLAGCSKKPVRPDPSATAMGPQGGGSGALNPTDVTGMAGGPDLAPRTAFDQNGQDRTTLDPQTVYFDFDKSDIKPSERTKLQAAKDYMLSHADAHLLLEGHCDWRGTAEYNLGLGDRRANAVKKYLQSIGVPAERMDTLSKGSLEAVKNADDATRAKDRRVNLVLVQPAGAAGLPAGAAPAGAAPVGAPSASPAPQPIGS